MILSDIFPDNVEFIDEALDDLNKLDGSVKVQVIKAIIKVSQNPRPNTEGGLGVPLRNDDSSSLAGFNKIKFKKAGIRCVYKCVPINNKDGMRVIVISARSDKEVYFEADKRIKGLGL